MKLNHNFLIKTVYFFMFLMVQLLFSCENNTEKIIIDNENQLQCIVSGLQFAEGPAYYNNNLYFTDIQANKIYKWNSEEGVQVFKDNSGAANGLYFNNEGKLFVCEGGNKRIVSIDQNLNVNVVTDKYHNIVYNEPNDLWISLNGDIYFTDPVYAGTLTQMGEYVYCIKASTQEVIKVIDDLVRPNGIIGNLDGSKFYVADHGASKIYQYTISSDGSLTNKQVFAEIQADGLSIDNEGNIFAASKSIMKFDSQGNLLVSINISGTITNLCFVKTNEKQLYITTHHEVYVLELE